MGNDNSSESAHPVTLSTGFWIDIYEVTKQQFAIFLNSSGNQIENGVSWLDIGSLETYIIYSIHGWEATEYYANHPVTNVTWDGAKRYCEWRGGFLPTEAQWEYAARGNTGRLYPWGDDAPDPRFLNYGKLVGDTREVGYYASGISLFGLYDMAGNVSEWIRDYFSPYKGVAEIDPTGPKNGSNNVIRGGSWASTGLEVRATYREGIRPDFSRNTLGFRCALLP